MPHVNWLAVIVAGIVGFFPGALWYSPLMFLKPWARELGIDLARPQKALPMPVLLVSGAAASIVAAFVLAVLIGSAPHLHAALHAALACAIGLVATSFAIQYLFERRSIAFWAINSGYHVVQFVLIGLVLSLWP
jgi:hypothetical protein